MHRAEKSTQSRSPYLRRKQCTSFVTIITIFPRSRARNARVTRSEETATSLSRRGENLVRALLPRHTSSLCSEEQRLALSCHREPRLVISAGSPGSCYEPRAEARARGPGARDCAAGPAERLQLRLRQPHVTGQGRSAFQEPGSAAARAPCLSELRVSQSRLRGRSGPSYGACSAPTRVLHAVIFCLI